MRLKSWIATGRLPLRSVAKAILIFLIVAYGALLRLTAMTEIFGPVEHPQWLRAIQHSAASAGLRPAALHWEAAGMFPHRDGPPSRYRSDPYTYLQYARQMRSFYAAHRREPLFPFTTKVFLWLLSDDDTAVSFASTMFSVLAIGATFILGAMAFGYWVGAGAALLMAIEYDLITWGVDGGRDDAFSCGVLFTCIALLLFRRQPGWRSGLVLGIVAGAACLIRITSLSFILPAIVALGLLPGVHRRERLIGAIVGVTAAACLVAPYLVNCWRVYGDPLYSMNVHASVYQETEGRTGDPSLTVREYLGDKMRTQPMRTIDTVVYGLTVYPFSNKWTGFNRWHPSAGYWLSAAAVAGLLLFVAFADGRILLLVVGASLLPYAATWKLIADWRFTQHAYPFFLTAACLAPASLVRGVLLLRCQTGRARSQVRSRVVWVTAAAACAALTWYLMTRVLPVSIIEESLRAGEPGLIMALDRDTAFFPSEWTAGPSGSLPTRMAPGWRAEIRMPLPVSAAYDVLLRVDPSAVQISADDQVARIQFWLNGRLLGSCEPGSAADRFGICRLRIPADAVRPGMNRLMLATNRERARGFRIWYVRVQLASG